MSVKLNAATEELFRDPHWQGLIELLLWSTDV